MFVEGFASCEFIDCVVMEYFDIVIVPKQHFREHYTEMSHHIKGQWKNNKDKDRIQISNKYMQFLW